MPGHPECRVGLRVRAPVTVSACTTHGQGTGGSTTGRVRRNRPDPSVVTARPSASAQESVPSGTPDDGRKRPQISRVSRARGRQPAPRTVTVPPVPASARES
ncbi:hypothetical protein JTP67_30805, partial [Streptomyces sp. S12]|nr:hypothetical protein [Streptomyces sp. S12]